MTSMQPGSKGEWTGMRVREQCRTLCLLIREREERQERDWERNIHVTEEHRSVASRAHLDWGSKPHPRCAPWPEVETIAFWCVGRCSNQRPTRLGLTSLDSADTRFIQRIIRKYYKELYANKLDTLEEVDKFIKTWSCKAHTHAHTYI